MFSCCYRKTKEERKNRVESSRENEPRPTSASQVCPQVADNNESNPGTRRHESQDQNLKKKNNQLLAKDKDIQRLHEELESYRKSIKEKDELLSRNARQIKELVDQNESLLTRLSKTASERLTDGNPNIADLSDENRPTKLAEQYSELYDNEWTDAFILLINNGQTEEAACLILVKSLCIIYITCKNKANTDMKSMKEAMCNFLGNLEPQTDLIKPFKDQRKKQFQGHIKYLKKEVKDAIKQVIPEKQIRTGKEMKVFLNKCVKLCWLMVIQDPSIFMDVKIERNNEKFDSHSFKTYTKSGEYIDYVVWPPIYLYEDGSILLKGVAQCKPKTSTQEDGQSKPKTSTQEDGQSKPKTQMQEDGSEKGSRTKATSACETVKDETSLLEEKGKSIISPVQCECIENEQVAKRVDRTTGTQRIKEAKCHSTDVEMEQLVDDQTVLSKDNVDTLNSNLSNCSFQRDLSTRPNEEENTSNIKHQTGNNKATRQVRSTSPSLMQGSLAKSNKNGNDLKESNAEVVSPCNVENHSSKAMSKSLNDMDSSTSKDKKRNSKKARSTVGNTSKKECENISGTATVKKCQNVIETRNSTITTHL